MIPANLKEETGKRYGRLIVVERFGNIGKGAAWLCLCECGNKKVISGNNLVRGQTKSCGCLAKELSRFRRLGKTDDIAGQKFGRLTADRIVEYKNYEYYWLCRCECGNEVVRAKRAIVSSVSKTPSCGCYRIEVNRARFLGKNNPRWRGGISSFVSAVRGLFLYREWRKNVLKKDNFTCQGCFKRGGHNFEIDHIKPFSLILFENKIDTIQKALTCAKLWDVSNGRVLCNSCHAKTDSYKSRMRILLKSYGEI